MAVGYALAGWTGVENMLSYLFEEVSGMPHVEAHITIASIVGFDGRLEMCSNLARRALAADPDVVEIWDMLCTRLSKGYKARHQIAHYQFQVSGRPDGTQQTKLVPFWSFGQIHLGKITSGLGRSEIDDKCARFQQLAYAVMWFRDLLKIRKSQPQGVPAEEPDLLRAIRETAARNRADRLLRAESSPE